MRLLPLLLLAAACGGRPYTIVDRQSGLDGSWATPGKSPVLLDVSGARATLAFRGRTFVFEGVGALRGYLSEDELELAGDGLRVRADAERIAIADGKRGIARPLAALPAGGRFVYRDGELRPG
jgi:hypothetical protein